MCTCAARSHVSDTVLTGSGPLCDITVSRNAHNVPAKTRCASLGDNTSCLAHAACFHKVESMLLSDAGLVQRA